MSFLCGMCGSTDPEVTGWDRHGHFPTEEGYKGPIVDTCEDPEHLAALAKLQEKKLPQPTAPHQREQEAAFSDLSAWIADFRRHGELMDVEVGVRLLRAYAEKLKLTPLTGKFKPLKITCGHEWTTETERDSRQFCAHCGMARP